MDCEKFCWVKQANLMSESDFKALCKICNEFYTNLKTKKPKEDSILLDRLF